MTRPARSDAARPRAVRVVDDEAGSAPVRLPQAPALQDRPGRPDVPPLPAGYGRPTTVDVETERSYTARVLRLHTLRMGSLNRFLLLEGMTSVMVVVWLADLAPVWVVPVWVVGVLVMVKLNDVVATALRASPPQHVRSGREGTD